MRLEDETPQSRLEYEVESILIANGYAPEDIQFRQEDRYLRIGYWRRLSDEAFDQLKVYIKEVVDMYDDDCGYLCFYRLNH